MMKSKTGAAVAAIAVSVAAWAANPSYKWTGAGGDGLWSNPDNWMNTATDAAEVPAAGGNSNSSSVIFDFTDLAADAIITNDTTTGYYIKSMTFAGSKGMQKIVPSDSSHGIVNYFASSCNITVPSGTTVEFSLKRPADSTDYLPTFDISGGGVWRWATDSVFSARRWTWTIAANTTVVIASPVADLRSLSIFLQAATSRLELECDATVGAVSGIDLGAGVAAGQVALNGHTLTLCGGTGFPANKYATDYESTIRTSIGGTGGIVYAGGVTATNAIGPSVNGQVSIRNSDVVTVSGQPFASTAALSIDGSGILSLGESQTVAALSGSGLAGGIDIAEGKTLTVSGGASGTREYTARLSGAGAFVKNGADELVLSGASTMTGPITVGAGTLTVTGAVAAASTGFYRFYEFEDNLNDSSGNGATADFQYAHGITPDKTEPAEGGTDSGYCEGRRGTRGVRLYPASKATVRCQGSPAFNSGTGPFTVTVWMVPDEAMLTSTDSGSCNAVFYLGSGGNAALTSFKVYLWKGTNVNFSAGAHKSGNNVDAADYYPDYGFHAEVGRDSLYDGKWHMLTVTYSGATGETGERTITGYLDGEKLGEKYIDPDAAGTINLNGRLHLGFGSQWGSLCGRFDDFKLLLRCQSAAEVKSEYLGEVQAGDDYAALPAPVAKWTFDDAANPGADTSGNGYDLTIHPDYATDTASSAMDGSYGKALAKNSVLYWAGESFPAKIPVGNAPHTISVRFRPDNPVESSAATTPAFFHIGDQTVDAGFMSGVLRYEDGYRQYYPALKMNSVKYANECTVVARDVPLTHIPRRAGWTHVVYVWNPNDGYYLYCDGRFRGKYAKNTMAISAANLYVGLRMAYERNNITVPFGGNIDDVRIWDCAFTSNQVVTLVRGMETGACGSPLSAAQDVVVNENALLQVKGTGIAARSVTGAGSLALAEDAALSLGGGNVGGTLSGKGQLTLSGPMKAASASAYYGNVVLTGSGAIDAPGLSSPVAMPDPYSATLASVDSLPLLNTAGNATFPAAGAITFAAHPAGDGDYLVAQAGNLALPADFSGWTVDAAFCAERGAKMTLYVQDGAVRLKVRFRKGLSVMVR